MNNKFNTWVMFNDNPVLAKLAKALATVQFDKLATVDKLYFDALRTGNLTKNTEYTSYLTNFIENGQLCMFVASMILFNIDPTTPTKYGTLHQLASYHASSLSSNYRHSTVGMKGQRQSLKNYIACICSIQRGY